MVEEVQLGMTVGSPGTWVAEDFEKIRCRKKRGSVPERPLAGSKGPFELVLNLLVQDRLGGQGASPRHRQALVSRQSEGQESAGMELSCCGIWHPGRPVCMWCFASHHVRSATSARLYPEEEGAHSPASGHQHPVASDTARLGSQPHQSLKHVAV